MRKSLLLGTFVLAALATGRSYAVAPHVTQPNGGEVWGIGSSQQIKWTGGSGTVTIKLDRDGNGIFEETLGTASAASGVFNWTVTGAATATAKIQVSNGGSDASDSAFTIADSYPETQFQITLPPDPTVRGKFKLSLLVAPVSPSDPNGGNPFGGSGARYAFKYIYTLTNLPLTSPAIDCIYLFDVSNCIDPFSAFDPKKTNGTTKANWEHNTWTASPPTNSVNWNVKATANPKTDGICSTASMSNPDTVLTFCVYTDRPPVESTFAVNTVYYTSASSTGGSVASGFFTYWTPGCPSEEPNPLPEGCEHRFHMAQVYPVAVGAGGFIPCDCDEIPDLSCWCGDIPLPIKGTGICATERLALPGFLCLKTDEDGNLDVNAFVTEGCAHTNQPEIVNWMLEKVAAEAPKCPGIFHGYTVVQTGDRIRTAWPLAYTTPGTTFTLTVNGSGFTERWIWEVVANAETFCHLIDLFHTNTLSVLEVPSIVGEDTYKALKECAAALLAACPPGTDPADLDQNAVLEAINDCEATIMANTLFAEHLAKPQTMKYPYFQAYPKRQLPPNKAIMDPKADGVDPDTGAHASEGLIGIIDTHENPAACKLLADLDYIAVKCGLRDP